MPGVRHLERGQLTPRDDGTVHCVWCGALYEPAVAVGADVPVASKGLVPDRVGAGGQR